MQHASFTTKKSRPKETRLIDDHDANAGFDIRRYVMIASPIGSIAHVEGLG
jgi:hypothetical protein